MLNGLRKLALALAVMLTPNVASAFDEAEMAFVFETMKDVQFLSFQNNREYCGYFGYVNGEFAASRIAKGRKASCRAYVPADDFQAVASFHTHGRYSRFYNSEIPSTDDLLTDNEEGVDGFMATPGGRLWFINGEDMVAEIICDLKCLPQDERFRPDLELQVQDTYTLDELEELE